MVNDRDDVVRKMAKRMTKRMTRKWWTKKMAVTMFDEEKKKRKKKRKKKKKKKRRRSEAERQPDTSSPCEREPRNDVCHARHPLLPLHDGFLFIVVRPDENLGIPSNRYTTAASISAAVLARPAVIKPR